MSSGIRNITRAANRGPDHKNYKGRGSQLGVFNPKAKDHAARLRREKSRAGK